MFSYFQSSPGDKQRSRLTCFSALVDDDAAVVAASHVNIRRSRRAIGGGRLGGQPLHQDRRRVLPLRQRRHHDPLCGVVREEGC